MYESADGRPRGERSTKWRKRITARMDDLMKRGVKLLLAWNEGEKNNRLLQPKTTGLKRARCLSASHHHGGGWGGGGGVR
jgi:hypothetical protein